MFGSNAWNYLTACKEMIFESIKNVTNKLFVFKTYITYV